MNPNINAINDKYYGADILEMSDRIVYVNGDIDPWHWLGINSIGNSTRDNVVIVVEDGFHCDDLNGISGQVEGGIEAYAKIYSAWDRFLLPEQITTTAAVSSTTADTCTDYNCPEVITSEIAITTEQASTDTATESVVMTRYESPSTDAPIISAARSTLVSGGAFILALVAF
jgi:hypothetical protein